MFKNTNGQAATDSVRKTVKLAMAVLVAVGSLAGGVGCEQELLDLARQAVEAQINSSVASVPGIELPGTQPLVGNDSNPYGDETSGWSDDSSLCIPCMEEGF